MRYNIDPDEFVPLLTESGLPEAERRDFILALAEALIPFVDAAWCDDGFIHMENAKSREKAAGTRMDTVKLSTSKQSTPENRAAFDTAVAAE